jgi:hypothetical protein
MPDVRSSLRYGELCDRSPGSIGLAQSLRFRGELGEDSSVHSLNDDRSVSSCGGDEVSGGLAFGLESFVGQSRVF